VQDCLHHCHELIEATVRDRVRSSSDVSVDASPTSSSDDDDNNDNDDRRQSGAVHVPTTPTDVRDINLVSTTALL